LFLRNKGGTIHFSIYSLSEKIIEGVRGGGSWHHCRPVLSKQQLATQVKEMRVKYIIRPSRA
jgi:hypothetical protein